MAQQTAVEWLINEIESKGDAWENVSIRRVQISIDVSDYIEFKRKAKQMEKEQIENAYNAGSKEIEQDRDNAAWYYFETYIKEQQ